MTLKTLLAHHLVITRDRNAVENWPHCLIYAGSLSANVPEVTLRLHTSFKFGKIKQMFSMHKASTVLDNIAELQISRSGGRTVRCGHNFSDQ